MASPHEPDCLVNVWGPRGRAALPPKSRGALPSMKASHLALSRFGWFVVVGAFFGARDMCAGNGGPPPQPIPPADAGPADASEDATMSLAPTRPAAHARHGERTLARVQDRAGVRGRGHGPV